MPVHRIRLRGPWQLVKDGVPAGTIALPARLAAKGVVISRSFGRPTGLDEKSRIWLVIDEIAANADAELNGVVLGAEKEFEITGLLSKRNTVTLTFREPVDDNANLAEVVLEIRA